MRHDPMSDIHVRVEGRVGRITLTRPQALNALTTGMIAAIDAAVTAWRDDPAIACVLIDAAGDRAFSAGGDIAEVHAAARPANIAFGQGFWADEYRLNVKIARYPKPFIALCQGYTMGGGVGVSLHGGHRIVCEIKPRRHARMRASASCPTWAARIFWPARRAGSASFSASPVTAWDRATRSARASRTSSFRATPGRIWSRVWSRPQTPKHRAFTGPPPPSDLEPLQADVDASFAAPDLATLAQRLEATDWGRSVLDTMAKLSPLSMACTLDLVRAARAEPGIEAAVRRENRFTARSIEHGELMEGIRAAIIDKDRAPKWRHTLATVPPERIAAMLAPLGRTSCRSTETVRQRAPSASRPKVNAETRVFYSQTKTQPKASHFPADAFPR